MTDAEVDIVAKQISERLKADVHGGDTKNGEALLKKMRKIMAEVQAQRDNVSKAVDQIVSENGKKLENAYKDVGILKAETTSMRLGIVYGQKAKREWCLAVFYFAVFIASLSLLGAMAKFLVFGGNQTFGIGNLPIDRRIVYMLPVYIPVIWLVWFANHRVNLSRRIAEAYSHKSLVGASYVGLIQQIEDMAGIKDEAYQRLKVELLASVIRVYERSPLEDIKGMKTHSPIGEASDAVAKILSSVPDRGK